MAEILRFCFGWIPFVGRLFRHEDRKIPVDLPPAKVAIIGGGIGGCSAAYFLRSVGGEALDIHLFTDGVIGGRCAVIEVDGQMYESGGAIIHSSNKYLVDFRKEFNLQEFNSNNVPTTPLSIFNGQRFVLQLGFSGIVNKIKILWNYGFSLFKLSRKISSSLKKFSTIYDKQADGMTYRTVPEMLQAMGGEEFFQETQVTAENYLIDGLGWNRRMVDELVCSAMKVNYGQNNAIDAFTAFVSLAGVDVGSLWSVVGGNYQIPKKALEASRAALHSAEVSSVTRVENGSKVSYNLEYKDLSIDNTPSVTVKDFDVVIIAHPLNVSKVKFENFPMTIYSDAAKTPYHRTVATFIKGEINGETFGITGNEYPRSFPLDILTTDLENPPVVFNSIGNNIPVTVIDKKAKEFCKPLSEQPTRIWKVFSNRPLTDEEKAKLFRSIDLVVVKDWMAYPQYEPPEQFPSFILDNSGLFYINCIEKAASAMEMSAIGAKNVALLAKDYILAIKKDE